MKLVFTLTAGRTGTAFLAELLVRSFPFAEVHHERLGCDAFGMETPDVSHLMQFNSRGNVTKVRRFWDAKLGRILNCSAGMYAETAHVLMKAGLVENAVRFCRDHELHFIRLRRETVPTLLSFERRGDFLNKASQWLWYLDESYSRTFIKPDRFRRFGLHGLALWYLVEIEFRAAYYRERYQDQPNVFFHETDLESLNQPDRAKELLMRIGPRCTPARVTLPEAVNVSPSKEAPEPEKLKQLERLVAAARDLDPLATAREYVQEGVDPFAPEEPPGELALL